MHVAHTAPAWLPHVVDAVPAAALAVSSGGAVLHCNNEARALLGLGAGEAPPELSVFVHEPPVRDAIALCAAGHGAPGVPFTATLRPARRGPLPVEIRLGPLDLPELSVPPQSESAARVRGPAAVLVLLRSVEHDAVQATRNEWLGQLMRLGNVTVFDHDHDSGVIYWTPEQRAHYGFAPDEVLHLEDLGRLVHPDDLPGVAARIARSHDPRSDGLLDTEHRFVLADGTVLWVQCRAITLFEGEGTSRHARRTVGTLVDISERRRSQEAMRLWHEAVMASLDALAITDLQGRLTFVNPAFVRMWGFPDERAIIGRSAVTLWEDPVHATSVRQAVHGTGGWSGERMARRPDGSTFPTQWSGSLIRDEASRPLNVVGSCIDLSVRKRVIAEREQLVAIIESTTDVVGIADEEGRLFYLNAAGRAFRGLAQDTPIDRLRVGENSSDGFRELMRDVVIPTARVSGTWQGEFHWSRAGETQQRPFSMLVVHHPGRAGRPGVFSCVARDLTERRSLETQLRQSQKMEAIGRLAGGVAHDFNNLLTIINGTCDILLDEPLGSGVLEDLGTIRGAGQSAAALTRQLLAFSRKQVLQPAPTDLGELVRRIERMLGRVIGEDVTLRTAPDADLWTTLVDPGQMEQVLMNLAVNARDAMPSGGTLTITAHNASFAERDPLRPGDLPPGDYVCLAVTDTGVGMGPEVLARLFEPFFSTKGAHGTGLGLATVYGIVRQSNGAITVESAPGRGSTFRMCLPRHRPGEDVIAAAPVEAAPVRWKGTVLVVEDAEGVRGLVVKVLEARGLRVLEAAHPDRALMLAGDEPGTIDLLITDVVMPGMSGRELAAEVVRSHPEAGVLFMSGYTADTAALQGVLDGGVAFLAKPFSVAALAAAVDEALVASRRPAT